MFNSLALSSRRVSTIPPTADVVTATKPLLSFGSIGNIDALPTSPTIVVGSNGEAISYRLQHASSPLFSDTRTYENTTLLIGNLPQIWRGIILSRSNGSTSIQRRLSNIPHSLYSIITGGDKSEGCQNRPRYL